MASLIDLEKITQDIRLSSSFEHASPLATSSCISRLKLLLDSDSLGRNYLRIKETFASDDVPPEEIVMDSSQPFSSPANRLAAVLQAVIMRKSGVFSWKGNSARLYLDENPDLADILFTAGIPVYYMEKGVTPVQLEQTGEDADLCMELKKDGKGFFQLSVVLRTGEMGILDSVKAMSPVYAVAGSKLFRCELGPLYNRLSSFNGKIREEKAGQCLSLFLTAFPGAQILMEGWTMAEQPPKLAEEGVRFESLDDDGNLGLSFFTSLEIPGFDENFVPTVRPLFIVTLNEEQRKFEKARVVYPLSSAEGESSVEAMLKKTSRLHKEELEDDNFFSSDDGVIYISPKLASFFLTENLTALASSYRLFGTDALKKYKLKRVSPKTSLSVKSGIDFFDTTCTVNVDGQEFDLSEAFKLYEANHYIPLNDGSHAIIDPHYFDSLRRILSKRTKEGTYKLSFFDLPIVNDMIDEKTSDVGLKKSREVYEGFNKIAKRELPDSLVKGQLRPYQEYGVKWLDYLRENNLGGCLADDMGLGKTLQAITLLSSRYMGGTGSDKLAPSLIVVPKSLISNWQEEIRRFAPELDTGVYYGQQRSLEEALAHSVVLTTYAIVRNDIEELQKREFEFVILDEAQSIKNTSSNISKAAMLLTGKHRFALSGTPMENNLGELYSLFRFLNPAMFGGATEFNRNYLTPIQKDGDSESARELSKKISPFILRRLKGDVAKELPEKSEEILYVDMSPEQAALYEQRRFFYQQAIDNEISDKGFSKATFSILQGLLELRQIATVPESKTDGELVSAKWETLLTHLGDVVGSGHKCLVFSNFLGAVDEISSRLEEEGIGHLVMTGATNNRAALVKQFQTDPDCKVFVMTLKTGGVGLNLTAADYVYIVDPWWNRSAEMQAIDRTHRIGQVKNVFCYRIIARGTIEEKILELQQHKKDLFDSVISADSQMVKKLTAEDVDFLLEGGE